jgi:hypothetical protein
LACAKAIAAIFPMSESLVQWKKRLISFARTTKYKS